MIGFQRRTRSRCKTLLPHAKSLAQLLFTGCVTKIGSRTSDIVYVSLEIGHFSYPFSLCKYGFLTSYGYPSALMKRYRAEIAVTETAAVMRYRKPYLFNSRNSSLRIIGRMNSSCVRQAVNVVKLLCCKAVSRRILHQHKLSMTLYYYLAIDLILPVILYFRRLGILCLFIAHLLEGRALCRTNRGIDRLGKIARSADIMYISDILAISKPLTDFLYLMLAHAVHKHISTAFQKHGRSYSVIPVVIMGKTSQ